MYIVHVYWGGICSFLAHVIVRNGLLNIDSVTGVFESFVEQVQVDLTLLCRVKNIALKIIPATVIIIISTFSQSIVCIAVQVE